MNYFVRIGIFSLVVLIALSSSSGHNVRRSKNPRLDTCVQGANCNLPACLCSDISVPGGVLDSTVVPQIVFLTFDGGITVANYPLYERIFSGSRKNPNGALISGTFFINHEYNDYSLTHQLYRNNHEIALKSISHKSDATYWKYLNQEGWKKEVADQRDLMARFAKVPKDELVGFRSPFLQGGGDVMYTSLQNDAGLRYDSSRPTFRFRPVLWPYTADYETYQECQIEPCPVESHPGFWVHPLVDLMGSNKQPCATVDTCQLAPESADETYELLLRNFEDHYNSGKAPFTVAATAGWLLNDEKPFMEEGYLRFVDEILKRQDVYIVSVNKGLDWIQNPSSLDDVKAGAIPSWESAAVKPNGCSFVFSCTYNNTQTPPEISGERIMSSCVLCPKNYPWVGNPMGV